MTSDTSPATVPDGYLRDAKGRLVPEHLVKPLDLLMDQAVRALIGHAETLSGQIARFRGHSFDDVASLLALAADQYGARIGGAKGNITLTSYDGCFKVQVAVADRLTFGPELQIAKALIDECIVDWSEGARAEIRALVEHAFRPDKEGQVSRDAVLALRRVEIDDERWRRAMDAITDSIRVVGSKSYIRFYRRADPQAPWQAITVDLAAA
ncbi:sulfate transporter [Pararhodospirillum oryzae]|uniref:Sulfate transporter n=2 Tax=Pararhodospirillum oryzae TaxID=478448 RepID=A0A512HA04_9PROT|nr:sulfate transporter [Pararhodospirillum oryzae]